MFTNSFSIFLITATLVLSLVSSSGGRLYSVPEPKIEIFKKGFRFSIPHEENLELFAFHGKINEPMKGLEAGQFSKDILKTCDNYWVFEDNNTKLNVGDYIYFWLFVIRNKLGYRYDNGEFVVKEILEPRPLHCNHHLINKKPSDIWVHDPEPNWSHLIHENKTNFNRKQNATLSTDERDVHERVQTTQKPPHHHPDQDNSEMSICCNLFLNGTYKLIALAEENERLLTENKILYEIAQKDADYSKTLRIFGKYPTKLYPTPLEFAQNFVLEKLLLNDVKVIDARHIPDNGISFKVEKLSDKVDIILAAKKRLVGSHYDVTY